MKQKSWIWGQKRKQNLITPPILGPDFQTAFMWMYSDLVPSYIKNRSLTKSERCYPANKLGFLAMYDFDMLYRSGLKNRDADSTTRHPELKKHLEELEIISMDVTYHTLTVFPFLICERKYSAYADIITKKKSGLRMVNFNTRKWTETINWTLLRKLQLMDDILCCRRGEIITQCMPGISFTDAT